MVKIGPEKEKRKKKDLRAPKRDQKDVASPGIEPGSSRVIRGYEPCTSEVTQMHGPQRDVLTTILRHLFVTRKITYSKEYPKRKKEDSAQARYHYGPHTRCSLATQFIQYVSLLRVVEMDN